MARRQKVWRLNYWSKMIKSNPSIQILDNPAEVKISTSPTSFIGVGDGYVSIGGGQPSKIVMQAMPEQIVYGGMTNQVPFFLQMIPSTIATPIPQLKFRPPFAELISASKQLLTFARVMM
jgi:hypothetical protein